jgi:hypothetical protein
MTRVTKAVRAAGYERARFIFDFEQSRIDAIVGEPDNDSQPGNSWDEE